MARSEELRPTGWVQQPVSRVLPDWLGVARLATLASCNPGRIPGGVADVVSTGSDQTPSSDFWISVGR